MDKLENTMKNRALVAIAPSIILGAVAYYMAPPNDKGIGAIAIGAVIGLLIAEPLLSVVIKHDISQTSISKMIK